MEKPVQQTCLSYGFNYRFLLQLLLIVFISSCDKPADANQFVIKGKYSGDSDLKMALVYTDIEENLVVDTIKIRNGRFSTKGSIKDVSRATLVYREPATSQDRKIFFFLESRETLIDLKSGILEDVTITGGKTQREFEYLTKLEKPIYKRLDNLATARNSLSDQLKKNEGSEILKRSRNEMAQKWRKTYDSIRTGRLNFAVDNPNSLLSGYFIGLHYFRSLPLDSVELYNQRFGQNVKNSLFGKILKRSVLERKTTSRIGDKAPNFTLKNIRGRTINLDRFEGKYLIINFWASTCAPCRKSSPRLKRIYDKFNPKGLELIALSSDVDINKWKKAIIKDGTSSWNHSLLASENSTIYIKYNIQEIPAYFLINRKGTIIGRFTADSTEQNNMSGLEKKLDSLFVEL